MLPIGLPIYLLFLPFRAPAAAPSREGDANGRTRVILIGVDGLGGEAVDRADCPNLRALMRRGAWTLKARGVIPTVSAPNWASVLTGAGPEQHGITSNGWFKKQTGLKLPTIFAWLRQQRPAARSAVFHDWNDIAKLVEPGVPDVVEHHRGSARTMHAARAYWLANQPDLMFVHLLDTDIVGHVRGWNSRAYLRAVE